VRDPPRLNGGMSNDRDSSMRRHAAPSHLTYPERREGNFTDAMVAVWTSALRRRPGRQQLTGNSRKL